MPANSATGSKLIDEAKQLGRHKTDRAAITAALREYVQYRKQLAAIEHFGTFDFDPRYDHKALRNRKPCRS